MPAIARCQQAKVSRHVLADTRGPLTARVLIRLAALYCTLLTCNAQPQPAAGRWGTAMAGPRLANTCRRRSGCCLGTTRP